MDLITALGRLLHDGALRDDFAAQPLAVVERLGVRAPDRPALLALSISDLEFQAGILLQKRFDAIRRFLPSTLAALGQRGRASFLAYARAHWPQGPDSELRDAAEFCRYCAGHGAGLVCPVELNRLDFALSRQNFAVHFIRRFNVRDRNRRALQIFIRRNADRRREFILYLGL